MITQIVTHSKGHVGLEVCSEGQSKLLEFNTTNISLS